VAKDYKFNSKGLPKGISAKRVKLEEMDDKEFEEARKEAMSHTCQEDFDDEKELA
jgi:hypothetical protein